MKSNILNISVVEKPLRRCSVLEISVPIKVGEAFKKLIGKDMTDYIVEVKKPRKSKNMNSYMWVLCREIGIKTGEPKEDVYRHAIRNVGKWSDMVVEAESYDRVVARWEADKEGWFAEQLHRSDTHIYARFYIGSSVYDAEELRRLTQFVVDEAKDLGIETKTPAELDHLQYLWSVM